ncbi:caspase family protein [Stieleria varia]|uniref:Caspase domain protein n=1 Tax=Stieleria varia TaxID=2528005 RepID=A0A5C6AXE1_9BACT|nr:caspase family protein [Stieleria varia]TWU04603.1 Caspase domain protein [Stieleria varia]
MALSFESSDSSALRVRGLFVGVEDFENGVVGASYCSDDATSLHKVFHEQNDDVILLCGEMATGENVLGNLSQLMNRACSGDLLVLFVSTIGIVRHNDLFFLPYDGDGENLLATGVSSKLLINTMGSVADQGVKVLLIFDTSHSGAIGFDISKSQSKNGGGISCFFSASPTEDCYESERLSHGNFSYHLVEGLRGSADVDGNGIITLRNLYDHVYKHTQSDSSNKQHPILIGTLPNETGLLNSG